MLVITGANVQEIERCGKRARVIVGRCQQANSDGSLRRAGLKNTIFGPGGAHENEKKSGLIRDGAGNKNTGRVQPDPYFISQWILSTGSGFAVAVTAIYRSVTARLERHFCGLAARRACYCEHLVLTGRTPATRPRPSLCLTARGTALGLIKIAPGLEEFLLTGAECERRSTIAARECLVFETHRMASSLRY